MALVHGTAGRVYYGTLDASPYLTTAGLAATTATADATVLTSPAKEYTVGQRDRTFSAEGYYSPVATAAIEPSLGATAGVLTYCPGGAALGDLAWLSSVHGTAYAPSDEVSSTVAFAWEAQTTGPTAFGAVLHPMGEDTNTTTGDGIDGGASSSTGWVAHLHVTLVDGGSWVVKVQDSADGSTGWADVSGLAFAAATGATSERLASSSTTATVKRHVRVVATRTGGSSGQGITYLLALSRAHAP